MEENYQDNSSPSPSNSSLPMILAILGVLLAMLLGVAGLIFGMQGKSRAIGVENKLAAIQAVSEDSGSMESRLEALELLGGGISTANNALADQVDGLDRGLRELNEKTQGAINQITQAINENRQHLSGKSKTSAARPSPDAKESHQAGDSYVIQSGDSFWKIANQLGISIKELEAVNPGVDPTRLSVGQTIKLPE